MCPHQEMINSRIFLFFLNSHSIHRTTFSIKWTWIIGARLYIEIISDVNLSIRFVLHQFHHSQKSHHKINLKQHPNYEREKKTTNDSDSSKLHLISVSIKSNPDLIHFSLCASAHSNRIALIPICNLTFLSRLRYLAKRLWNEYHLYIFWTCCCPPNWKHNRANWNRYLHVVQKIVLLRCCFFFFEFLLLQFI